MRTLTLRRGVFFGIAATALAAALGPGCGGDEATISPTPLDAGVEAAADNTVPPADTGSDTKVTDAPVDRGVDAPSDTGTDATTTDAPSDAIADAPSDAIADAPGDAADAGGCVGNNTACQNGASNGLCKSNVCSPCVDPGDDSACATAYAAAYLCIGGACVPANCRANGDCTNPTGQICGLSTPNLCAKCTSDAQCRQAYSQNHMCTTTAGANQGACVPNTCAVADNTACVNNASDVCCSSVCVAGNCCVGAAGDTFCRNLLANNNAVCSNNTCTTCAAVSNNTYNVDPDNGNDASANGSGQPSASCAFKTITRALQFIGPSPALGTQIVIKAGASVSAGETFPIIVPANVTIRGAGGGATVRVPAASRGFTLTGANSGLATLTIDGADNSSVNVASNGVVADTGSAATTTLANVTVKNFADHGILVINTGVLSIGQGVVSTNNGTTSARRAGLRVVGSGRAIVSNTGAGVAQTSFSNNTRYGIEVEGAAASVGITGTPGTSGAGTVVANGNFSGGLAIGQGQSSATNALNTIDGLVAWANTNGSGIQLANAVNVKIRNSYLLSNNNHGVIVTAFGISPADVSKIDLGTASDFGKNTLQASLGSGQNSQVGICYQAPANSGTLTAQGNIFAGPRDCSSANPGQISRVNFCASRADVGIFNFAPDAGAGNNIDVANCTKN